MVVEKRRGLVPLNGKSTNLGFYSCCFFVLFFCYVLKQKKLLGYYLVPIFLIYFPVCPVKYIFINKCLQTHFNSVISPWLLNKYDF